MKKDSYNATNLGFWGNLKQSLYEAKRRIFPRVNKNKNVSMKKGMWLFSYAVWALPIVYFLIFYVYLNFNSVMLAFKDVNNNFTLENFNTVIQEIVKSDGEILIALRNTLLFFTLSLLLMPVNIVVSYALYKQVWGYKFFEVIFYLPSIIGGVVWMTAYKNFIHPNGPLFTILLNLQLITEAPELLANTDTAIWAVLMSSLWLGIPSSMLVYLGTLARIPQDVMEAAELDGVGFWREIANITVPLIWPAISTNLLFAVIGFFGASGNVLLLTEGRYNTTTLSYWLYDQVVVNDRYNVPSAMGILMTIASLPLVVICRWLSNKVETIEF